MNVFLRSLFLTTFFGCWSIVSQGQNLQIQYAQGGIPDQLVVCGAADTVTVQVRATGGNGIVSNVQARINLFQDVTWVGLLTGSTSGVAVLNDSNPQSPLLSLPEMAPNGNIINIQFLVKANCNLGAALASNQAIQIADNWTITYVQSNQNQSVSTLLPSYNDAVDVPYFNIILPTNLSPLRQGMCFNRPVRLTNSSLQGSVDSLRYQIRQGKGISIQYFEIGTTRLNPTKSVLNNGDTLATFIFTSTHFAQIGNGNSRLEPNESIILNERLCVAACQANLGSEHQLAYACNGTFCASFIETMAYRIGEGTAVPTFSNPENSFAGYCNAGTSRVLLTNDGTDVDSGFGTMMDIELGIGFTQALLLNDNAFTLSQIRVAGAILPLVNGVFRLDGIQEFSSDPDGVGGLTDADGDGFFDDLPVGQQVEIIFEYEFNCNAASAATTFNQCRNDIGTSFFASTFFTDRCGQRLQKRFDAYQRPSNRNILYENSADADAFAEGDPFIITHKHSRSVRGFVGNCPNGVIRVKVNLPQGITPHLPLTQLIKNGVATVPLLQSSLVNDTLILDFNANFSPFLNGDYTLNIGLNADCTASMGATSFPISMAHFCPSCNCNHTWMCDNIVGPKLHATDPPCPPNVALQCPVGVQTNLFSALRSTFGFSDNALTQPFPPVNANKNVALACDSISMKIGGKVGMQSLNDGIGAAFTYRNLDGSLSANEILVFGEGQVRFNTVTGSFTCVITTADVVHTSSNGFHELTINLGRCLRSLGLTLEANDEVLFEGKFYINPDGPFSTAFRQMRDFRGYLFYQDGSNRLICDDFGADLTVGKAQTVFVAPNNEQQPKGCETNYIEYRLITVNNGFKDFFGTELRGSVKVDSIVFDFEPALLDGFANGNVEVSVANHPIHGSDFFSIGQLSDFPNGHFVSTFNSIGVVPNLNTVQSYAINIRLALLPNCQTSTSGTAGNNKYILEPTIYFRDRFYANAIGNGSCAIAQSAASTQQLTYSQPPSFVFTPLSNNNVELVGDTATWQLQHCNLSFESTAGMTWLMLTDTTGHLTISSIQLLDDGSFLPIQNIGTQQWFVQAPNVLEANGFNTTQEICNTFEVKATVSQCEDLVFGASAGWDCSPNIASTWTPLSNSNCEVLTLPLQVSIRNPFLQASIIDQPTSPPALCDTSMVTVVLKNVDQGTAFDIIASLFLPAQGAILVPGGVEVAYPSSAAFRPVANDPVFVGSSPRGLQFAFNSFNDIDPWLGQNGLQGIMPTMITDSNEIKLRFRFLTDCNFQPNGLAFYEFQGRKGCGELTNVAAGESYPLTIAGFTASVDRTLSIRAANGQFVQSGGQRRLVFDISHLNGSPTTSQDKISLTLDQGMTYQVGSTIAGWAAGNPSIILLPNGNQQLTWSLPAGISAGQSLVLSILVQLTSQACAVTSLDILANTFVEQTIRCVANNSNCIVQASTQLNGGAVVTLPVNNNGFLQLNTVTSVCGSGAENVTISGSWISSSPLNYTSIPIQYVIDENNNGQQDPSETVLFTNSVSGTGNVWSFQHTFSLSIADLCQLLAVPDTSGLNWCNGLPQIPVPTPQIQNAGSNQQVCYAGGNYQTTLGISPCVGTNYAYVWSAANPSQLSWLSNTTVAQPQLNIPWDGSSAITATYFLSTTRGCATTVDTVRFNLEQAFVISFAPSVDTIQLGDSYLLSPTVTGGGGNINFQWAPVASLTNALTLNPTASPNQTTTYSLTFTSSAGCQSSGAFTLFVENPIDASVSPVDTQLCANSSFVYQVSGGTNAVWIPSISNPASSVLSNLASLTPSFTASVAGIYNFRVIVTNPAFPSFSDTLTTSVTVLGSPQLTVPAIQTICSGTIATINANSTGFQSIEWSPAPMIGQGTNVVQVNPIATTTYTVAATGMNGCVTTRTTTVTVQDCGCQAPEIISQLVQPTPCGLSQGVIQLQTAANTGLTVVWSPDVGVASNNNRTRTQLPAGEYTIRIVTSDPACFTEIAVTVPSTNGPQATVLTRPATCSASNGTADLSPSSLSYLWEDGSQLSSRNDLAVGNYFVTVTDATIPNCSSIIVVQIGQDNPLTIDFTIDQTAQCGVGNGVATLIVTGGSGNYTYSWPSGMATQSELSGGVISVQVTDNETGGCTVPFIFVMPESVPSVAVLLTDTMHVTCPGGSNGGVAFTLEPSSTFTGNTNVVFTNGFDLFQNNQLGAGSYCLEVRNDNGCVAGGACFTITAPEAFDIEAMVSPDCQLNGSIELQVSGGTAPYSMDWNHLAGTNNGLSINGLLSTATYGGTLTDALGCTASVTGLQIGACPTCDFTFGVDTIATAISDCASGYAACLDIAISEINQYSIAVDGQPYVGTRPICGYDTLGFYALNSLVNAGPFTLNTWTVNGTTYSFSFSNIGFLLDSVRAIDPLGNWMLSSAGQILSGGVSGSTYSPMQIMSNATGASFNAPFNPQFIPSQTAIVLQEGTSVVSITYLPTGCSDTLYAFISCSMSDTLQIDIPLGSLDTLCFSTMDLLGDVASLTNVCIDTTYNQYAILNDTCVVISPIAVGASLGCWVLCDELGICDTTYVQVNIFDGFLANAIFDTIVVNQTVTWCPPDLNLSLPGTIVSITNDCGPLSGLDVVFGLDNTTFCVSYTGVQIGTDTACIRYCDVLGNCESIPYVITVVTGEVIFDTLVLSQDTGLLCIGGSLTGNIIDITNLCPDDQDGQVSFNIVQLNGDTCIQYWGVAIGQDTACYVITDDLGNRARFTFYVQIVPVPINQHCDTVFVAESKVFCLNTTNLQGPIVAIQEACTNLNTGNVEFFYDNDTECVEFTGLSLGQDSTCFIYCDAFGHCDTTLFCIYVERYVFPPTAINDTISTLKATPVVINIKANDTVFGGIDTAYILVPPIYGEAILNLDCSITYLPDENLCEREDRLIYVVCNPNGCDTAEVFIFIECISIEIFNAVSPNGDGVNDVFFIAKIQDFPDNRLRIFNRWGNQVYDRRNYNNDWSGTWDGNKDLPDGTYFYILEVTDNGATSVFRGYFELFR